MRKNEAGIVEYVNLPMNIAFQNQELLQKGRELLGKRVEILKTAGSTFQQFMILGNRDQISKEECQQIKAWMEQCDETAPYPFSKRYPELEAEQGCIRMQDISYTKVYAVWINGQSFAIDRIVWKNEKHLLLYPWEVVSGVPWKEIDGEKVLEVPIRSKLNRQEAWKQILFQGEVDLRKVLF